MTLTKIFSVMHLRTSILYGKLRVSALVLREGTRPSPAHSGLEEYKPRVLDRGNPSAVERGAKSLADDLGMDRDVVPSRAAASLRSAETNPFDPRDL